MESFEPEINNIKGVQFSIMSPDEIGKWINVVEITKYETYDKDTPIVKGLFDILVWDLQKWEKYVKHVVKRI